MLLLVLAFCVQGFAPATVRVFAEDELIMPVDEALVDAVQIASGGYDPQNRYLFDDPSFTSLDLSRRGIFSLDGLNYWLFPYIKTVNLSSNRISVLEVEHFSSMPLLEEIVIADNYLNEVNLSGLSLARFVADGNSLAQIDLNFMRDEENAEVSLNSNLFTSLQDIQNASNQNLPTVWLANNQIVVQPEELIPQNFELLLQGARDLNKFITQGSLTLFASTIYPNLVVTINDEELQLGQNAFGFGQYQVRFLNENLPIENLKAFGFQVIPPKASIEFYIHNEKVEYQTLFEKEVKLMFASDVPNATVFFRINNGEWQQGNELHIAITGNFNIYTQVRIADVVSDSNSAVINVRLVKPIWFFVMFLLVVTLFLGLMFGYYYLQRSKKWKK